MATTKNNNLFYLLYSKDNSVAQSGYACSSNVDESDTSFDISGSEALITDSNGDVLASVDLSSIHAANITQYNVETKILQPKSAYLLLGNEYGETYKQLFFKIYDFIYNTEDYTDYCNIQFDILYKQNGKKCNVHVNSESIRETYGSVTELIQTLLNKLKVPVSISIRSIDDENSSSSHIDYINFSSTEEGYDFIVRNVVLTPVLRDSENSNGEVGEFSDSPFTGPEITNDIILDLLNKYQPTYINKSNDNITYKTNCDIYRAFMQLSNDITDDFNTFVYELNIIKNYFLPCFEKNGVLIFPKKFNDVICKKYELIYKKYFTEPLSLYNEYTIYNILNDIKDYVFELKNAAGPSICLENLNKRIENIKYKNGALRGIVLIPDWPTDYDTNVLMINHVADTVEICIPVDVQSLNQYFNGNVISNKRTRLFEKALATVKVNALIPSEKELYIEDYDNLPLNDISSNDGFTNSFDDFFEAGFDNNDYINNLFVRTPIDQNKSTWEEPINYHNPDLYVDGNKDDEDVWETNPNKTNVKFLDSHANISEKTIGLYKYMEYLSTNDLWLRVGDSYMIIGKDDNLLSTNKNLLQSLLVYNPNDVPIRIKYIIFS